MRGLSLTRKLGESVILHAERGEEQIIIGVVTVMQLSGNRVRLRFACPPSVRVHRYDDPIEFEQEEAA